MPRLTMLSWNVNNQNPLSSDFALQRLIRALNPDMVGLCEVGETVLYELFAHEWIKLQGELDAIAPFVGRLDKDGAQRFTVLSELVTLQLRFFPGAAEISPAFIPPVLPVSSAPRKERYRDIAKSLRLSYSTASIAVRDAHAFILREMRLLKLELRMIGANADWAGAVLGRSGEKHPLLQDYCFYLQMVPQDNRHYLILSKSAISAKSVEEVGGKRPLLCLNGVPQIWYIHAIANKSPAKKQILDIVGRMESANAAVVLVGDLNKERRDLISEAEDDLADVRVSGCGKPTHNGGHELDYAIATQHCTVKVERVELVDSDHFPIFVTIDY